jgi:WD40 repeat protein
VYGLQFSPDGSTLAATDAMGAHYLVSLTRGRAHQPIAVSPPAQHLAFGPKGSTLFTGGDNGWLRCLDLATGRIRCAHTVGTASVDALAASPDGTTVATASGDDRIRIWQVPR